MSTNDDPLPEQAPSLVEGNKDVSLDSEEKDIESVSVQESGSRTADDGSSPQRRERCTFVDGRRSFVADSSYFNKMRESRYFLEGRKMEETLPYAKLAIVAAGLIVGIVFCFIEIGGDPKINQTLSIAIWMATLWLTEIIPLVVTAFIPLFLFPMFGILSSKVVAVQYANDIIFLLIAGFLLALTIERWDLHRRLSLKVLTWCGTQPHVLLFGLMGSTFFLSMYISNTATTLMMVPNGLAICNSIDKSTLGSMHRNDSRRLATAIMLGIAYAANIGGMSSLIGTAPNLVLARTLSTIFPDSPEMTFAVWYGFALPIGVIIFFFVWLYLSFLYLRNFKATENIDRNIFNDQYTALGPWSREQVAVSLSFVALALLWLFRKDLDFGGFVIKGWSDIFPDPTFISDATIGMLFVFLLFVTPARKEKLSEEALEDSKKNDDFVANSSKTTLLDWPTANKMPYDIIFLLGGGFALAKAFVESGLSAFLGSKLAELHDDMSLAGLVYLVVFVILWLTELTSNTATANIFVPIAASIAIATNASPYTFMVPAAMACSCAFCLPIATPPNMVVFSTGRVPMREMNKAGVLLNVVCSVIILGAAFTIVPAVTKVGASEFPEWAENSTI